MINVYCRSKRFGYSLTDSDECNASISVCDVNADCKNTLGSYRCSCRAGFSGDGHTCKGKKNFIRKRTFLIKQLCRCKVIYFSKLSLTIILLDLKLFRVSNLLFITRAFRGKRSKYKFGFFFFFLGSVTKRSSTTAHA